MQLVVFALLMIVAVAITGYGLFHKEAIYAILGFSFLFILGVIMGQILGGVGLQVETGANISYINSSFTSINYVYTSQTDANSLWFGRFIAIGAAFGMATVFFMLKSFYGQGEDYE